MRFLRNRIQRILCKHTFAMHTWQVIVHPMSKIRFRIIPPVDRSPDGVFISGSSEALGAWDPVKALRLTWQHT